MYQIQSNKKQYRKILWISALVFGTLVFDHLIVTSILLRYSKIVLGLMILFNMVVATYLSNSTFYASKININRQYMAIAFGAFLNIINMVITLSILLSNNIILVREVNFFLAMGKILFGISLVIPFLLSKRAFF